MSTERTDEQAAIEGCLVAVPLGWVLGWGTGAVRALVAMKGWEWFVADTFGLPVLSFVQAWGLFVLVSFAVLRIESGKNEPLQSPIRVAIIARVMSLISSGLAFTSLLILSWFL